MRRPSLPSPRERHALLTAIREGRPPDLGHRYVLAGRDDELRVLSADIDRVTRGASAFRLVLGPAGAGTTFLLGAARSMALDRRVVTGSVELDGEHRIQGGRGQVTRLYRSLVASLSTRAFPHGGALPRVVERLVEVASHEARAAGVDRDALLRRRLSGLVDLPGGAAYGAAALAACRAWSARADDEHADAIAWLSGSPTAGRRIDVPPLLTDTSAWDHVRLLARVCRLAGFAGLLVLFDGADAIARLRSPVARAASLARLDQLHAADQTPGLGLVFAGNEEVFVRAPEAPVSWWLDAPGGPVLRLGTLSREARLDLLRCVAALTGREAGPALLDTVEAGHREIGAMTRELVLALDGHRVAVKDQERDVHP